MLFNQTIIVLLMYVTVALVYVGLFHTRWGLRLRAVGEHPQAADTVGINIAKTRFWNVSLGGAIAGLGGAFFTLGSVGAFNKEMTAGAGIHRPRGGHLRPVGPHPRHPRGPAVRVRVEPAEHPRRDRIARAPASSCSCCRTW